MTCARRTASPPGQSHAGGVAWSVCGVTVERVPGLPHGRVGVPVHAPHNGSEASYKGSEAFRNGSDSFYNGLEASRTGSELDHHVPQLVPGLAAPRARAWNGPVVRIGIIRIMRQDRPSYETQSSQMIVL